MSKMIAFEYHDPNKTEVPLDTLGFMLPLEHLSLRIDEAGIRAFDGRGLLAPVVLYSPTWIRETRNYTHRYGALIRGVWSLLMWDIASVVRREGDSFTRINIAGYEATILSKLEIAEVEAKLREEIEAFEGDVSGFISQVDKEMGIDE